MLLMANQHPYNNVKWAPSYNYDYTINSIKSMLSKNIPVVFSYDTTFNDLSSLELYKENSEDAINDYSRAICHEFDNAKSDTTITSHYMTIIDCIEYLDEGVDSQYILKVISWGDVYYIRYEDFARGLSVSQNILEIS